MQLQIQMAETPSGLLENQIILLKGVQGTD